MSKRTYLWQEDECLRHDPDAERIKDVIEKFTGMDLPTFKASSIETDHGDGTEWHNKNLGIIVGQWYDGWCIEKVEP